MSQLVERAKDLAQRAHAGQTDKAGRPYIEHVARVAAAVSDDPEAEAVAWLHDVIEDCDDEFRREILSCFPERIYRSCCTLDRNRSSCNAEYYAVVRTNEIALRVKLADIADNSSDERLSLLDGATAARLRRKYTNALRALHAARTYKHGR